MQINLDVDEPLFKEWLVRDRKNGQEYSSIATSMPGRMSDKKMMTLQMINANWRKDEPHATRIRSLNIRKNAAPKEKLQNGPTILIQSATPKPYADDEVILKTDNSKEQLKDEGKCLERSSSQP